jgi:hypothetical protein
VQSAGAAPARQLTELPSPARAPPPGLRCALAGSGQRRPPPPSPRSTAAPVRRADRSRRRARDRI